MIEEGSQGRGKPGEWGVTETKARQHFKKEGVVTLCPMLWMGEDEDREAATRWTSVLALACESQRNDGYRRPTRIEGRKNWVM